MLTTLADAMLLLPVLPLPQITVGLVLLLLLPETVPSVLLVFDEEFGSVLILAVDTVVVDDAFGCCSNSETGGSTLGGAGVTYGDAVVLLLSC